MAVCIAALAAFALLPTDSASATWSIVIADLETKEVAVGTVTCLTSFDLCAIVPVVVVGKGAAAVQAAGDFNGIRRPVIFDELMNGTDPEAILALLAQIGGHQSRQYGIADTQGRAITFTGSSTFQWAGGLTGIDGTMVYAIQGNVLAGECVVSEIEVAMLATPGDMAEKLMAGMEAAYLAGGDGRCSCTPNNPTACGCPPPDFNKAGHIGCMVVARTGDTDDTVCNASGCADGDYLMHLNVAFQNSQSPDPVIQLRQLFDDWRNQQRGRPDGLQSVVTFNQPYLNEQSRPTATMTIELLDWEQNPITNTIQLITVEHAETSAGSSAIGLPVDQGNGVYTVELTAGQTNGVDRFRINVDDGVRPVVIMPEPSIPVINNAICSGNGMLIEGSGETGDFNAACGSDNSYWAAHGEAFAFQLTDPVVQFELTATGSTGIRGGSISVDIEASKQNDNADLNLRALLYDFTNSAYVSLPGTMSLATADSIQNFALPGGFDPADFIEPGTNEVRLLLQTIQTSGLPNVRTQLDEVLFNFK